MENSIFMQSFRCGDEDTFRKVYEGYFHMMCLYAFRYTSDSEAAADIVQDTFVSLWRLCRNFDSLEAIRAFLYITVRNKAINYIRRKKMANRNIPNILMKLSEYDESHMVIETEVARQLIYSMQMLPRKCREVLQLSLDGNSYQEIGNRMNITVSTVKNQRARAIKLLKLFHEQTLIVNEI